MLSAYSTYLHEKGFPAIFPKLKMLQITCEYFFSFFTDILPSANFIGRYIRNGCFFDVFYMVYNESALCNSYYFNKIFLCSWDDT